MLGRLLAGPQKRAVTAETMWGPWPGDGATTWAGVRVDAGSAMQLMAVYGCVRLISDSISTLPVDAYRKTADGRVQIAEPSWLRRPTVDLDFAEWCGQVLASLLLHGNAYVLVLRSGASIVELPPLDPAKVVVRREAGRKTYWVMGQRVPFDVLHIKGMMLPGADVGVSPVEYARQTIGLGLAAQEYGARFFDTDGNMPGVIELPKPEVPEKKRLLAEGFARKISRGNRSRLPGVLDDGAVWKATSVTPEQAQFLGTRQFSAAEIAGQMFLVDPSDLGIPVDGMSLTYANLTERNTRRVQVTLLPWIVRIETALSSLLPRPQYVKLNVEGLLRGDTKTRWETYAIAEGINASASARGDAPVLETDEMRRYEDLNPLPKPDPAPVEVAPNVPA